MEVPLRHFSIQWITTLFSPELRKIHWATCHSSNSPHCFFLSYGRSIEPLLIPGNHHIVSSWAMEDPLSHFSFQEITTLFPPELWKSHWATSHYNESPHCFLMSYGRSIEPLLITMNRQICSSWAMEHPLSHFSLQWIARFVLPELWKIHWATSHSRKSPHCFLLSYGRAIEPLLITMNRQICSSWAMEHPLSHFSLQWIARFVLPELWKIHWATSHSRKSPHCFLLSYGRAIELLPISVNHHIVSSWAMEHPLSHVFSFFNIKL